MDIYEFSQVLWRRKWLLLSGFVLLVVFVAALSLDFSDGVKLRVNPKFQAQVQIAVVPEGYSSLTRELGPSGGSGTAQVFASLLSSKQAVLEIAGEAQARLLEFEIGASGRDRFVTVKAITETPDGAVAVALGAFDWLEGRLAEPLLTASAPDVVTPTPDPIDDRGEFHGNVRLEIDHSLANESDGLWLVTRTLETDRFAYRLSDAADEASVSYAAAIAPGKDLTVILEDASGDQLDLIEVAVPPFPDTGSPSYELVVELNRGLVRGAVDDPQLDVAYAIVDWSPTLIESVEAATDFADVSILLLTDRPVAEAIGGRKAPLLIVAMLTAGVIALLVIAVVTDSWSRERKRRRQENTPVTVPASITSVDTNVDGDEDERLRATH